MKRRFVTCFALWVLSGPTYGVPTNVAEGATVTPVGTYGVLRPNSAWTMHPVAAESSLTDAEFLPAATVWNDGSVWWDAFEPSGASASNSIELDLGATWDLFGFIVQADDNDTYRIDYWNGGSWVNVWDIPAVGGFGDQTRPNKADNTEVFELGSEISTDRLRFTATGGDGFYSVTEVQAFANTVPEPAAVALIALGLIGFSAARRMF